MKPHVNQSSPVIPGPLGLLNPRVIRVHDVRPMFSHLSNVAGLRRYPERALVLPGITVVEQPVPSGYLDYLAGVGLGAPAHGAVIEVPLGDSLLGSLNQGQVDHLSGLVRDGWLAEFFVTTPMEPEFVARRFGLPFEACAWGPPADLAAQVNDKVWLRRFAASQGLPVSFPEHVILRVNDPGLLKAAAHFVQRYNGVVLKHPALASGDGMFFARGSDWQATANHGRDRLASYRGDLEIIVEADYPEHLPLSAQLEVGPHGVRFICSTVNQVVDGAVHTGNLLGSKPLAQIAGPVALQMEAEAVALAHALYLLGYRGYLGFDFILTADGLFMIEGNGRTTAATYPLAVSLQAGLQGLSGWGTVSENLYPSQPLHFMELAHLLAAHGLLFNGLTGVLPVCPSLLPERKAMLYSVGADPDAAVAQLHATRQLLGSP